MLTSLIDEWCPKYVKEVLRYNIVLWELRKLLKS